MGIFDIIELKNHIRAIEEYLLYLDSLQLRECVVCKDEFPQTITLCNEHCKKMLTILDKFDS